MKRIVVEVKADHLQRMAAVKKPILAIAELVWNALDADATQVVVSFEENAFSGITSIRVVDNGSGMTAVEAEASFKNLGGSWKKYQNRSQRGGRLLHGRAGKGRFRAFSLGEHVSWTTCAEVGQRRQSFTISGTRSELGVFEIGDSEIVHSDKPLGTEVHITEIHKLFQLRDEKARTELTEQLAIYLRHYADITVVYDGRRIDPKSLQSNSASYELAEISLDDGRKVAGTLEVIEWRIPTERSLYLCDEAGLNRPGFRGGSVS